MKPGRLREGLSLTGNWGTRDRPKLVGQRKSAGKVKQGQPPDLVIVLPILLQGRDVVALCFLLPVERQGKAVDVGLSDDEALTGFLIGHVGQVEGPRGTLHQGLLEIEVVHCHDDLLLHADFLLPRGDAHHVQVIAGHVVLAFAHAPVHQRNGNGHGDHILLQRMTVGAAQVFSHLVEADTCIEAGVESGFHLGAVDLLFGFEDVLPQLEKVRIVLAGHGQGLVHRDRIAVRRAGKHQAQLRVLGEVEEGCQGKHRPLQTAGGCLKRVAGIHVVQFQRQEVGTADGGYLETLPPDAVEGIGAGGVFPRKVILGLCHSQFEEVSSGLLADLLGVVEELLLDLLILQRLYLAFPAESVVTYQVLRIAYLEGNAGVLGILVGAEVAHITQGGPGIERTAGQVNVLIDGQVAISVEGLLGTVDVDVLLRVIAAGDVAVILRRSQVQCQRGQAVGPVGAVFPKAAEVHILGPESLQRTVIGQTDGLFQVQRQGSLCGGGHRTSKKGCYNQFLHKHLVL